jgi:phenylpropionate dioxygenase-like ring-hydroxylating dioxygenase large terminal subunit
LLNTCMHRGMKVCRYDEGNTPVFSCPYHGWSYSTDGNLVSVPGELIGVPQFATAYHGELKKEDWGLISVPQMKNYRGSIWACWDKNAPSFEEFMGDHLPFWNGTLDGSDGEPGGVEVLGLQKFIIPCNWKYGAENFVGDNYHATTTHRSVNLIGISPQGEGRGSARRIGQGRTWGRGNVTFPHLGHGGLGATEELSGFEYIETWPGMPEVEEFYRAAHKRRQERMAAGERRYRYFVSTTFPNTSTHSDPHAIFTWHPRGPMSTELWRWFLVDKNAPQAAKDAQRHFGIRYAGPAGMTEQDDAEAWNYATYASNGTIARRRPFAYVMGLGHEKPAEGLEGATYTDFASEANQRKA